MHSPSKCFGLLEMVVLTVNLTLHLSYRAAKLTYLVNLFVSILCPVCCQERQQTENESKGPAGALCLGLSLTCPYLRGGLAHL